MKAVLALEDGAVFKGESFGWSGESFGEVVFNTSMAGYQEIITDPSYKGQIVAMTYPLIGNYGINETDIESRRPFLSGFAVREYSKIHSNWRSQNSLGDYLKLNKIVGIEGIDTRALTLHIRQRGAMKAVISALDHDEASLVKKAKDSCGLVGVDLVKDVAIERKYEWEKAEGRSLCVVVLDCGLKYNMLRRLQMHNCRLIVVPASTPAKDIMGFCPDGLLLSNGPGDPEPVTYVVKTVQSLVGKLPVFGICLGHQMLGLAFGGKTYKLKFGHHGANHPVKDLRTGRVYITSQNHGFCVDIDSLDKKEIEMTHINLNDKTMEGLRHRKLPVFSVQFHPEASPGPRESGYLFGEFVELMKKHKRTKR